jgi:hypothetical protein
MVESAKKFLKKLFGLFELEMADLGWFLRKIALAL